jgi:hypothetical protein
MKFSAKKIVLLAAIAVVVLLVLADEYPALRFRGDAKFSGGPVFGYEIRLRRIPFYEAAEYVFHFRGLPNEKMSLSLYAEGQTNRNLPELVSLETSLEARLVDQDGRVVCHAENVPRDGKSEHIWWVVVANGDLATFWHNCVQMRLKPSTSYTLTLRIARVDPKTPRINLLPVLEGGRLEL